MFCSEKKTHIDLRTTVKTCDKRMKQNDDKMVGKQDDIHIQKHINIYFIKLSSMNI